MGASVSTHEPAKGTDTYQAKLLVILTPLLPHELKYDATFVVDTLVPETLKSEQSLKQLLPRENFGIYRDWSVVSSDVISFFVTFSQFLSKLHLLLAYVQLYGPEVASKVDASKLQKLQTEYDLMKRHVENGLIAAMYSTMQRLQQLHVAWRYFLDKNKVLAGFTEAAKLVPIQVVAGADAASTPMSDLGLRVIAILNYFVRKWKELTERDEYVNWVKMMATVRRKADRAVTVEGTKEFKKMLNTQIEYAKRNHVIMSDALLMQYKTDLQEAQSEWQAFLMQRPWLRYVPCVVVIGTHGEMKEDTDPDFTLTVPAKTSITRVVTTPAGYVNVFQQNELEDVGARLKTLYVNSVLTKTMLDPAAVLDVVSFPSNQQNDRDLFQLPYKGNIGSAFAKRYMPGQSYLNKQYEVTVEEYLKTSRSNPEHWFDNIRVLINGNMVDVMKELYEDMDNPSPQDTLEMTFDEIISMIRDLVQGDEVLDVVVVDVSCSEFYDYGAAAPRGLASLVGAADAGKLSYESEPEFKERVRAVKKKGLLGGAPRQRG